jgi:hypothetical protein
MVVVPWQLASKERRMGGVGGGRGGEEEEEERREKLRRSRGGAHPWSVCSPPCDVHRLRNSRRTEE